jgi:hypothetical protein
MRIIDVKGMLRQASTRVSLEALLREGKQYISMLSRDKIDEMINRSVKTIVDKHRFTASPCTTTSAQQIEWESRAEFEDLLHQYRQTTDATTAVEHSKQTLEQELRESSLEFHPRQAGLGAFEDFVLKLQEQVAQIFKTRTFILERSESPQAVEELHRVEEILGDTFTKLFHVNREQAAATVEDDRETPLLKKRIEKLSAHIATMETAIKTLSTAKTFSNQQIQNLIRDLGLAQEDKNLEKKKEMLSVVLNQNRNIRQKAQELAAQGVTLEAPRNETVFTKGGTSLPSTVLSRSSV